MGPTRNPAPTSPFVDALAQLAFTVHGLLGQVAAEHDLSVTQLRLLGILRDRTPSMAGIADHLGLDRSSVTGLVDRAATRGLVAREPSPTDARVTLVRVTPAGVEVGQKVAVAVSAHLEELGAALSTSDRAQVVRLAGQLLG